MSSSKRREVPASWTSQGPYVVPARRGAEAGSTSRSRSIASSRMSPPSICRRGLVHRSHAAVAGEDHDALADRREHRPELRRALALDDREPSHLLVEQRVLDGLGRTLTDDLGDGQVGLGEADGRVP